ncbi:hemolysin family protein [Candidatus Margulisiibacteriota bacterium]
MSFDLFILLVLLAGSAFFSGSETSLTTLGKAKLKSLINKGNKTADILDKLLDKPGRLLATVLVGNNLVNIAFTVVATTILLKYLEKYISFGFVSSTLVITLILSFVVLVFGEIIPKMLALSKTEKFAFFVARPIYWMEIILRPFVVVANGLARLLVRMAGVKTLEKGQFITEEELKTMIEIGREEGVLEEDEKQMLTGVIDLGETIVRQIMTPRVDMAYIDVNTPIEEIINLITQKGHSRLPVYEEKRDNIIGILYAKDLLKVSQGTELRIRNLLRPVQFVPETKKIDDLLKKMRTKRSHIAIVIDEHGGVSGLVTIEDILEEIVGEITDEYDEVEGPSLLALDDTSYLVDAGTNVYDLNEEVSITIPEHENYDTVGGFMAHELGEIPKVGDKITYENFDLEVTQAKKQRILQLKLTIDNTEHG